MNLPPLHERDYASRCRIAHALVVADQRPDSEVAELLHVQFYDVPDMVAKGAAMMRYQPEPKAKRAARSAPESRPARNWTPAELRMLEANRIKFRNEVLKKWGSGS
jgi:hypothetical protein